MPQLPWGDPEFSSGPWNDRVTYLPTGEAVEPGRLIVAVQDLAEAASVLADLGFVGRDGTFGARRYALLVGPADADLVGAMRRLHTVAIESQPSHVLFADCCGPSQHPLFANPVRANPVRANAFYEEDTGPPDGCGGCCCPPHPSDAEGLEAAEPPGSRVLGNPVRANPVRANGYRTTGVHPNTSRPAGAPAGWTAPVGAAEAIRVAVLDTGLARPGARPPLFQSDAGVTVGDDQPDEDNDGGLDTAAGHGTFVAGLIRMLAPQVLIRSVRVLGPMGEGVEPVIAHHIDRLAESDEPIDILNLSFGGYAFLPMQPLIASIRNLQRRHRTVVVASAGNDATCRPTWPAAIPSVVAVGALDANGVPAPFTNFGPWVRACALGTDVVSAYFDQFDDALDGDHYDDWAMWSGTSFAAPIVAGMVARTALQQGISVRRALTRLLTTGVPVAQLGVRVDLP